MKVHLRADSANGTHTTFTVFVNGANCGQLFMREEEAIFFHHLVLQSDWLIKDDEVYSSGIWTREEHRRIEDEKCK